MSSPYETKTVNGRERPVHILLMEKILGRELNKNEVVHHINGDKQDNRPENLQVMTRAEHTALHKTGVTASEESLQKMSEAHKGWHSTQRKLTDEQVQTIAKRLLEGATLTELSKEYGISKKTIAAIRDGKIYRDSLSNYPDSAFPLQKKRRVAPKSEKERKFSVEEVTEIRIQILLNQSINSIAKAHHTSPATVRQIRDHETYQDIPWPEEIGRYSQPDNSQFVLLMLLSLPMSDIEDEHKALKEDYHLVPDYRSVLLLRAVRRAMAGDTELAAVLMLLGGYETDLSRIIEEESVIVNTLYKKKPIDSFTFEN